MIDLVARATKRILREMPAHNTARLARVYAAVQPDDTRKTHHLFSVNFLPSQGRRHSSMRSAMACACLQGAGPECGEREAALRVGVVLLVALHVLRLQCLSSLSSNSARRRICGPCNAYFVAPARAGAPQFTLVSFAAVAAGGARVPLVALPAAVAECRALHHQRGCTLRLRLTVVACAPPR